jgi:HSP20 family molecular chaperone IbpA
MWAQALEMLDEANRLQRRFFQVSGRPEAAPRWEPPVDIFESEDELWLFYALPGVATEQIEVGLEGAELVVRGERRLRGWRTRPKSGGSSCRTTASSGASRCRRAGSS